MKIENFVKIINSKFYTGVPDSQLKPLCNYLIDRYGIDYKHGVRKESLQGLKKGHLTQA